MGINTAEIQKPKVTKLQNSPDLNPRCGGRIKFPAPKKRENKASAVMKVCFEFFILLIQGKDSRILSST
jgi:hypothetical protein